MKILLYLTFVTFITSCSCQTNNNKYKKINEDYLTGKSRFEKKYISHFPDMIDDNFIDFNESLSPEFDMVRLTLINKISSNDINLLSKKYKNSIGIYSSSDTCLLVVNRFATRENYLNIEISDSERKLINRICYSNKYPIPNFWHNAFTDTKTDCRLPANFTIYVINSEAGVFLEKEKLSDGRFIPANWKHGYSYGIAISEKHEAVIYWVVMW